MDDLREVQVPESMIHLLARCTASKAERRLENAAVLAEMLERESKVSPPPPTPPILIPPAKREEKQRRSGYIKKAIQPYSTPSDVGADEVREPAL
jgi:hypothetical protein